MSNKNIVSLADPSAISLVYLEDMRVKGRFIYGLVLFIIIVAFALLPVIKVNVSVRGSGILQPNMEKNDLLLPISGRIAYWNSSDNQYVKKGDTLLRIDAAGGAEQNKFTSIRIAELEGLLADIQKMSQSKAGAGIPFIKSAQYKATWLQFEQEVANSNLQVQQIKREHDRYEKLVDKKVISIAEYEQYHNQYTKALADHEYIFKRYHSQWQAEGSTYRAELNELYRRRAEWTTQESFYTLIAPVSGTIQNLSGLQVGSPVFANQKIGEVSPDSSLVVMVYLSPSDIGLVKPEQEVRFQIEAFNYNQWGMLGGKVTEIADDVIFDGNQQPVYRVKCLPDSMNLRLANGYIGQLKKGMTLQARFTVARRSLFQLLYDKVDHWLNP